MMSANLGVSSICRTASSIEKGPDALTVDFEMFYDRLKKHRGSYQRRTASAGIYSRSRQHLRGRSSVCSRAFTRKTAAGRLSKKARGRTAPSRSRDPGSRCSASRLVHFRLRRCGGPCREFSAYASGLRPNGRGVPACAGARSAASWWRNGERITARIVSAPRQGLSGRFGLLVFHPRSLANSVHHFDCRLHCPDIVNAHDMRSIQDAGRHGSGCSELGQVLLLLLKEALPRRAD